MSTWVEQALVCPECTHSHLVRVAIGISIGRAPNVRDDVLERRLHHVRCGCGQMLHVAAAFEYTDLERNQLVLVRRPGDVSSWREHEAQLHRCVRHTLQLGSPLVNDLVSGVKSRVVFSQEELREKLVVWAAGVDDGLVECIKVRAFATDPRLATPGSRLLVDRIELDALQCRWFADGPKPTGYVEIPPTWLHEAERDRASLETRFPELFADGFVSARRLIVE